MTRFQRVKRQLTAELYIAVLRRGVQELSKLMEIYAAFDRVKELFFSEKVFFTLAAALLKGGLSPKGLSLDHLYSLSPVYARIDEKRVPFPHSRI